MLDFSHLKETDAEVYNSVIKEYERQQNGLELIASENRPSEAVLEAQASYHTLKYAEGYPGKRYYAGCENIDATEQLAIDRACKLFGAKFANVQPHSGAQANAAVFYALLNPGDKVMGMSLNSGGHLTHCAKPTFSAKYFTTIQYEVNPKTYLIDYDEVEKMALEFQPKLIVAGASAYPRAIDFKRFREIADKIGAYLMVDMAHIAGLVATGLHQSPIPYADVVTSTTHKTLRGTRGGLILTNNEEIAKKIDKAIFPGLQGGGLQHIIAAKAVTFGEALKPEFKTYMEQVVKNAKALAQALQDLGFNVLTGGTDNHLILLDLRNKGITGLELEQRLTSVHIITNKNAVPFDTEKKTVTSGIRLGTPAVTSRGLKEEDMKVIAELILDCLVTEYYNSNIDDIKAKVQEICDKYPLY